MKKNTKRRFSAYAIDIVYTLGLSSFMSMGALGMTGIIVLFALGFGEDAANKIGLWAYIICTLSVFLLL